jgi:oligopeptide transport system permease protein
MCFWKKKKNASVSETPSSNDPTFSADQDFRYVQLDASIHERKFSSKPTTFFKDALKRFAKSKSSVTAAAILAALIFCAIIVPAADRNNINDPNSDAIYLPPKWFDNANGFLDGTGYVRGAVIDPLTNYPAADPSTGNATYKSSAILGDIKTYSGKSNQLTEVVKAFGSGGAVSLSIDKPTQFGALYSSSFTFDNTKSYSISLNLDAEAAVQDGHSPTWELVLKADFKGDKSFSSEIPLLDYSKNYGKISLSDSAIRTAVTSSSDYVASGVTSFNAYPEIKVQEVNEMPYPTLYITSFALSNLSDPTSTEFATINWDNATKMLASKNVWAIDGSAVRGIYGSNVLFGDFRYDYYAGAFGTADSGFKTSTFSEDEINDFISRGWMTYSWQKRSGSTTPGAFKILDSVHCPIRSVSQEIYQSFGTKRSSSLVGMESPYRYHYYRGWIATCAPQKYAFGTNGNGQDFAKIVFSGLLTSLELGLFAAVINITIGLLWGSISGYFGGLTDMLMERVTEILGGIPWIVMMTLIVLKMGSNFWTFLLALCLTGWMGVAGQTRSQFYRYKGREYVLASRTLGASDWRLIFKHILPNGIGTIVTSSILMIPGVIFSEATISYLLPGTLAFSGSQSFGVTLSSAQALIGDYPYLIVSASIIMMLIMISFNLFGNGLRDAFNPSLKGAED